MQAHCQRPTSQRKRRISKFSRTLKRKKIKHTNPPAVGQAHRPHRQKKKNQTNDKFNMKEQFDSVTDRDNNRQCITVPQSTLKRAIAANRQPHSIKHLKA